MLYIALLLGVIEGVTEFIPVSSTGHLVLFGDILGFQGPSGKVFEVVIQLGAIGAVCWLYREKIIRTLIGMAHRSPNDWRFAVGLLAAFLPAMALGVLFYKFIKAQLFDPVSVSVVLIMGGVAILLVERFKPAPRTCTIEEFSLPLCLKIGLCQCLSLIPGTSRAGATILGALLLGVERKAAAEFSFFLAIPTMLAATVFDLYENRAALTLDGVEMIAVGFVAAFISALFVVRAFIAYVAKHGFAPFAVYRIIVGAAMLCLLYYR